MKKIDAMTEAYLLATAKTTLPTGVKRQQLDKLCVKFYRDWQVEPGEEWESLKRIVLAGTAIAGQDTYELDDDIHFISKDENNYAMINGTRFKVVSVSELGKYKDANAVTHLVDDGTHSIKFSRPFTAATEFIGKSIAIPCVIKLDDILKDTDEILIDQPAWLPARVAAQYAFSYKSLRDMYDDLLDMANEHMESMKDANEIGNESYNTGYDYFAGWGSVGHDR